MSYKQVLSHDVILWDEKRSLSFQVTDVIPYFLRPSPAALELSSAAALFFIFTLETLEVGFVNPKPQDG